METNSKKLEMGSRIIYYTISFILCVFLILLTNKIIDDIDKVTQQPKFDNFENKELTTSYKKKIEKINDSIKVLEEKRSRIEKTIVAAKSNREKEKESFDNWIITRQTIGSPTNDNEVVFRTKKLDELLKIEQDWQTQQSVMDDSILTEQRQLD